MTSGVREAWASRSLRKSAPVRIPRQSAMRMRVFVIEPPRKSA
eukprot:CAMPEP_0205943042 /NCGR_PEP_ID=MMETSP1325-20131115/59310_1 /ASSEMBLY_ACC=CAM_ASM_000708 /TAXON_ID=236786 /ORGANISM="Florenciella sp., Strain RCC1007" /LENGTH=42 /DNA_ID= /DNA_START= /DNA_END= /DNA_ORIENTATION=